MDREREREDGVELKPAHYNCAFAWHLSPVNQPPLPVQPWCQSLLTTFYILCSCVMKHTSDHFQFLQWVYLYVYKAIIQFNIFWFLTILRLKRCFSSPADIQAKRGTLWGLKPVIYLPLFVMPSLNRPSFRLMASPPHTARSTGWI